MIETDVSGPRRPDPQQRWTERLSQRLATFRDQLRLRLRREPGPDAPSENTHPAGSDSWRFLALIAVGSAALALGSLWIWQSWSQRSDPPIDDLLPLLVGESAESVDAPADDPEREDGGEEGDDATTGAPAVPEQPEPAPLADIVVHVSGAVRAAGVVSLPPGARVFEAVDLAGGARDEADLDRVNLAAPLVDGERIHVPAVGEGEPPALLEPQRPPPAAAPTSGDDAGRDAPPEVVDLNLASAELLQMLPGIGPATADSIAATREQRGPFRSVDELLEVPGIGETKLAQLRPFVTVGSLGVVTPP